MQGGAAEEEALLLKSLDIFKKILNVRPLGSRVPSADPSQAHDGAPQEARLRLSLEPHGHRPALLPQDRARRAGRAADRVVQQRLPFFGFSAVPPVGNGIWSQEDVFEIWKEEFEGAYEEGGFFNLMGHPQVVGRPSRMRMVSRLIELILGKGDVWVATPIQVAEHYLSQR